MAAIQHLCIIIGINSNKFTKEELIILDVELFTQLCIALEQIFLERNHHYFRLIKFTDNKEKEMHEGNLVFYIVNDILISKEYSIEGIAYYTQTPEDVIFEIAAGKKNEPSALLLRKIIELHRLVRPQLYYEVLKKLIKEYFLIFNEIKDNLNPKDEI